MQKQVCYAQATVVDEPTALSVADALAFRTLWRERQQGGAVPAAASQRSEAEEDSDGDSWDPSQPEGAAPSQDSVSVAALPTAKTRVTTSAPFTQQSRPSPNDESEDDGPAAPSRPAAPAARVVPSSGGAGDDESEEEDSDGEPPRAAVAWRPPPAPRRSFPSRVEIDSDSDSEESDDDNDGRQPLLLTQSAERAEPTQGDSSQEPSQEPEPSQLSQLPDTQFDPQGPDAVRVEDFDAAALRNRITGATPSDIRVRVPAPCVEVLDSTMDAWWRYLRAVEWNNEAARRGLDKLEFGGDRSRLDGPYLPSLAKLRDDNFQVLVVDQEAAKNFQKHLKGTNYTQHELINCYGFEVTGHSWVGLFKGVDGAPPEIVAVVANGTRLTREAFVARNYEGVRRAEDMVAGGEKYLGRAKRGNVSDVGKMELFGARKPRMPKGDQKRKPGKGVGVYCHDSRALTDGAYLRGCSYIAVVLSTFEAFYAPERHAARVLLSDALNIPAICQGIPRYLAAAATIAMSRGYACRLHTDKSGETVNETIVWSPLDDPPQDWCFVIACFGRLVDLTGPDGVFVTLSGYRTVHSTVVSAKRRDHRGMGFAAVLKENLITVQVRDALALGPKKKKSRVG